MERLSSFVPKFFFSSWHHMFQKALQLHNFHNLKTQHNIISQCPEQPVRLLNRLEMKYIYHVNRQIYSYHIIKTMCGIWFPGTFKARLRRATAWLSFISVISKVNYKVIINKLHRFPNWAQIDGASIYTI